MTLELLDVEADRARIKTIWTSGNFGKIAESIQSHAAAFVDRLTINPYSLVLDLACGTSNIAVEVARWDAIVIRRPALLRR